MLDLSSFIRIRNNRLEVYLPGFSVEFSNYARNENPENITDTKRQRIDWMCSKIKPYLIESNLRSVVLDCRMQNGYINSFAKEMIELLDLNKNEVLILTTVDPKGSLDGYNYVIDQLACIDFGFFYTTLLERKIDWENVEIEVPIISLSCRPTEQRARLTKALADLCGERARLSFGNNSNWPLPKHERELYTSILDPYPFPFKQHTDDRVLDHPCDIQHNAGYNLFQSLVSVINETNDFDNEVIQVTEKSFKHFAWHQIPIFNASKGHFEIIRDLGFDMFDDIIDHSYSNAPNIHLQKLKILNVVAKFLKDYPTLKDVNNLRKSIFPRLQANNDLLYKLYEKRPYEPWPYYG